MPTKVRVPNTRRRFLPHWEKNGAVYFITFRLADSLPGHAVDNIKNERQRIARNSVRAWGRIANEDLVLYRRLFSKRTQKYLDARYGACYLANPRIAALIADAFEFFNGRRYQLFAWCIMPNHVHVICRLLNDERLERVLHSWKSFTAVQANRVLGRRGEFWMKEYYDRIIRNESELKRTVRYVLDNPGKAGLRDWEWVRVYEDARWG